MRVDDNTKHAALACVVLLTFGAGCSPQSKEYDQFAGDLADGRSDVVLFPDFGGGKESTSLDNQSFELPGDFVWHNDSLIDIGTDFSDPGCDPGTGCFGEFCSENGDCQSGVCILHMGNRICTRFCTEECPSGFSCAQFGSGPDMQFACLSEHSHLCLPCDSDSDCSSDGQMNRCAVYGSDGAFCSSKCANDSSCPVGYSCRQIGGLDGNDFVGCVADSLTCECSKTAVDLAMSTVCTRSNNFGECFGQRTCGPEGLSDCDARTPSTETCNGVDDNCSGNYDEATCDDGNQCTQDDCEGALGCKHLKLDNTPCSDGNECTFGDICISGSCKSTDLICYDNNPCTDDSCDPTSGCLFQPNTASCSDNDPCTFHDICENSVCMSGTISFCDDGNICTDDYCDDILECIHLANAAECNDGNACTQGDHCEGGWCVPLGSVDCDDTNICTTDACDDQGGCLNLPNTDSCDDKNACTIDDYCSNAYCISGSDRNCDDFSICTMDSCDTKSGCKHTPVPGDCNDLDPCTVTDTCLNGECVGSGLLDCGDTNPCTDDSCLAKVGCQNVSNVALCSDGNACTDGDSCVSSQCVSGPTITCNDFNECTIDSCNPATGCVFSKLSNTGCSDNSVCTSNDKCLNGVCIPGPAIDCADLTPCTFDLCDPGTGCYWPPDPAATCTDGNACTLGDHCQNGACAPGTSAPDCNDNNDCTSDSCNPALGCVNSKLSGTICNDNNACTSDDTCSNGVCSPMSATDCDDKNVCTDDSCSISTGCIHLPNSLGCSDGNACTANDYCQNTVCKPGSAVVCNDNKQCTDDSCDTITGCKYTPDNTNICSDSDTCTLGDHCSNGACVINGNLDCNDNSVCTNDLCDKVTGCYHTPQSGECSDNNKCTEGDSCSGGECIPGAPVTCNDNNQCTDDSCNISTGCVYARDDSNTCTDNDMCTLNDRCVNKVCINDGAPDCNDNDPCTSDVCVKATGCTHPAAPYGTPCNDNNMCTLNDYCDNKSCKYSSFLVCDDGNVCTSNECLPASGCNYPPVAGSPVCDDGRFCTSNDKCSNGVCAGTGVTVCPTIICKYSSCHDQLGCQYTPKPNCCGDGTIQATAGEECDDGCAKGDVTICDAADNGDGCESTCKVTCFFKDISYMYCNGTCSYAGDSGCDQSDADLFCRLKTCNSNAYATAFSMVSLTSSNDKSGLTCAPKGTNKGPQPSFGVNVDVWYSDSMKTYYPLGTSLLGNVTCAVP